VLDDLHWAAQPTLLMLRYLIRSERPLRTLVLGSYRETELTPAGALMQLLADLQRDASATTVQVGGLNEHGIAALLEAAAGHALAEPGREFARVLQSETGGNPFFIREVLAHLAESGAISRADERWTTDLGGAELEVPERLRQVIRHRVARLPEPARRALAVGAVAGPPHGPPGRREAAGDGSPRRSCSFAPPFTKGLGARRGRRFPRIPDEGLIHARG
jgi:predicted ATPase